MKRRFEITADERMCRDIDNLRQHFEQLRLAKNIDRPADETLVFGCALNFYARITALGVNGGFAALSELAALIQFTDNAAGGKMDIQEASMRARKFLIGQDHLEIAESDAKLNGVSEGDN